jgi:hypothetical protein
VSGRLHDCLPAWPCQLLLDSLSSRSRHSHVLYRLPRTVAPLVRHYASSLPRLYRLYRLYRLPRTVAPLVRHYASSLPPAACWIAVLPPTQPCCALCPVCRQCYGVVCVARCTEAPCPGRTHCIAHVGVPLALLAADGHQLSLLQTKEDLARWGWGWGWGGWVVLCSLL